MSPREVLGPALADAVRELVREVLAERDAAPRVEGFIGTAEAARRAGIGTDTVVAWISRGLLPATRPPGTRGWRIRPADLEAVLSERSGGTPLHSIDLATERARRLAGSIPRRGGDR